MDALGPARHFCDSFGDHVEFDLIDAHIGCVPAIAVIRVDGGDTVVKRQYQVIQALPELLVERRELNWHDQLVDVVPELLSEAFALERALAAEWTVIGTELIAS
jgi:hypothetical protein